MMAMHDIEVKVSKDIRNVLFTLAQMAAERDRLKNRVVDLENVTTSQQDIEAMGYEKLPVGKDGLPIRPGETLYGEDGKAWRIDAVGRFHAWAGLQKGEIVKRLRPDWLTHTAPESWTRLMDDAGMQPFAYCAAHGLLGEEAPTNEKFARDLVRRAKKLAGVDAE